MRGVRKLANALALVCAVAAVCAVVAWCVSRAVGDASVEAQFAYWAPTWAYALAAFGFAGVSWCLAMLGRPSALEPRVYANPALRTPRWRVLRRAGAGLGCVLVVVTLMVDWRMVNAIAGPNGAVRDRTVRIVNWNPTATFLDSFADTLLSFDGDVALVANPPAIVDWTRVRDGFAPGRDAMRRGRFAVVSRHAIRRWGWADLKVQGSTPQVHRWKTGGVIAIDTGQALWMELDTVAVLGQRVVVWFIDMPSDPKVPRARAFREAAATIEAWEGPAIARAGPDAESLMSVEAYVAEYGRRGFPRPDLVIGDFNTPRGSPSIRALVPEGMTSAFEQAGYGPMGTWPRPNPVLGIDQAFTAAWLDVTRYDVRDPGAGEHRVQVIEVARR